MQHMHETLMTRTSQEANDIVANSRKNPLEGWRRLHKRHDLAGGGRKRNILHTIISPKRCSLQELQAAIERWENYVARYEELKGKMDDEIKRAGLESLVPEELENHLISNSNRLKTFEDARSEIATYVEGKIGLIIRKPSEAGFCERSDPTDVGAVSFLSCWAKENGHQIRKMGVLSVMQHIFNETATASKHMGKQTSGKGEQSKSWSMSEPSISGKGKGKENPGKSRGLSRRTKSGNKRVKGSCEGKTSEMGQVDIAGASWIHEEWNQDERNDDWNFDESNDDRNFVGWREDCEQTHVTSVTSFSLESSEWVKTHLDTRAVVNTLPSNFGSEGIGDGSFHDWIPDGEARQFQGYDQNGFPRSLDGRLMDAYEVLNSSASASASVLASRVVGIACEQQQDF